MFSKKKQQSTDIFDVAKICATCKHATPLSSVDDFMCPKHGLVNSGFSCKKYEYNLLMKRPHKKRTLNTGCFSQKDFSID